MPQGSKVALVTGGARRLGRAICSDLARHGFAVAIHFNRSGKEAAALADAIAKAGGRAATVQADLTDLTEAAALLGQVEDRLGPAGLIVNNASVFEEDAVTRFDAAAWQRHFDIHLRAPALLAQAFHESLAGRSEGLIINMIDQRVWRLTPRHFSYTLSKAALWTATRTMAQALAPHIRVNAIGPGPTLPSPRQDQEAFERQAGALILERGPLLSEFGATIRYLWEARSVTGQMIALDGGQHLAWQTPDVAGAIE